MSFLLVIFFATRHRSRYLKMVGVGSWGGFKSCLYVPQMPSACSQTHHWIKAPFPSPLVMNYICSNWIFFFSCYFSEGHCPWVSLCLSCGYYCYLSTLIPHLLCFDSQDPADSGALARPHLHRGCVFQRGANRLWQRPKVSQTVQSNKTQEAASQRAANGLENNGCALLWCLL